MKVQMKDGTIIECTPQEWLELQKNDVNVAHLENENIPPVIINKKITVMKNPERRGTYNRVNRWTPEEIQIIIDNKDKPTSYIKKLLPNKHGRCIQDKIYNLGIRRGQLTPLKKERKIASNQWTPEEDKILRENAHLKYKKIHRLIPRKTIVAIRCRVSLLKLRKNLPKKVEVKKPSVENNRHKRLKWIHDRAGYLANLYKWTYDKAFSFAINEYDKGVFTSHKAEVVHVPVKVEEEFPIIYPLSNSNESLKHFEEVLKNLFSREHGNLTYYDVNWIQGVEWSGKVWHNFLTNIFAKQQEIFKYFMMNGELKIVIDGAGYEVLNYTRCHNG